MADRLSYKKLRDRAIGFRHLLYLATVSSFCLLELLATDATAQTEIVPDTTLGAEQSILTSVGEGFDVVEGGATRGTNLFHSFEQFGINRSGLALFLLESSSIENVFSRVTGDLPSSISGVLATRVFQGGELTSSDADFYLINPNGVIFGEGALLDIGGSFSATAASSLSFDQVGGFSATTPQLPGPQLTINPSAYLFETSKIGDIVASLAQPLSTELAVRAGESITLLGGNVALSGDEATQIRLRSFGGRINLGAIASAGSVNIATDGTLDFANDVQRGNVSLVNSFLSTIADINDADRVGRDITITARNIAVLDGSFFTVGTFQNQGTAEDTAGSIVLDATDTVQMDSSFLGSATASASRGGNIEINGRSLQITASELFISATNQGIAGNIFLTAPGTIVVSGGDVGTNMLNGASSGGGDIDIQAGSLQVIEGTRIASDTFSESDTGNITIRADDAVVFQGSDDASVGIVGTQVQSGASGNGGNIEIAARSLRVANGAGLNASTSSSGAAGDIIIAVTNAVNFVGTSPVRAELVSGAFSEVGPEAEGKGGNVEITAEGLTVLNGARLSTNTFGIGDAGSIVISTDDAVSIAGTNTNGVQSQVTSNAQAGSSGDGGSISISANTLNVLNSAALIAGTVGSGNAGGLFIDVEERATFAGKSPGAENGSLVFSSVGRGSTGNGGSLVIEAESLWLSDDAELIANTAGNGQAGQIQITADGAVVIDDSSIFNDVEPNAVGNGGSIEISARSLSILNEGQLQTSARGEGDAGSVVINARDTVTIDASKITSDVSAGGRGNSGDIDIRSVLFQLINAGELRAETNGEGNAGNINVAAGEIAISGGNLVSGVGESAIGNGGNIELFGNQIDISNGAQLLSSTFGRGNAGNIVLTAEDDVLLVGSASGVPTAATTAIAVGAVGDGGDIQIFGDSLRVIDGAAINASVFGRGNGGDIAIAVREQVVFEGVSPPLQLSDQDLPIGIIFPTVRAPSTVSSTVSPSGEGNGGDIGISADSLQLLDGASLFAGTFGEGDSGSISISVEENVILEGSSDLGVSSSVITQANLGARGTGGDINVSAAKISLLGEAEAPTGPLFSASATGESNTGNIQVVASDELYLRNAQFETFSEQRSGGNITVVADRILLEGPSGGNLTTQVLSGEGTGGNITLDAKTYIIAFDDTDILSSSPEGTGGNITFQTPAFFGENISINSRSTDTLLGVSNGRVDVNATGRVDGSVSTPDVSLVENNLTELTETLVDTDVLVASSCIVRNSDISGQFVTTGSEGLAQSPDDDIFNTYSLSSIEPAQAASTELITEPHAAYRLSDGRILLSKPCNS